MDQQDHEKNMRAMLKLLAPQRIKALLRELDQREYERKASKAA